MKKVALLGLALVPLCAIADDPKSTDAVEKLKASLTSGAMGFEVDDVRVTDDGVACIKYRIDNDLGGETRAQAVVDGDKVLRSTSRSNSFAKAWNKKCAGRDSETASSKY